MPINRTLQQIREDLAFSLEEVGINTKSFLPERIMPPVAVISASDPYIEQGITACLFKVSLTVTIVASKAVNSNETDNLDSMIERAIMATGDWFIDSVSAPFVLEVNNANYLASKVSLSQDLEIEGG